ncbi:unnamed protein product [Schistocephalus solidus]|uniref:Uncharacterized protein n=1 Tax=Schistocephalus solidus TaxID=70667 RepID=A0A183S8D7_SCHSO|nr:unnamed protein product [Schistocephalus solidus]
MQDAWMTRKTEELQGFTDRNEGMNFFAATKAVYGPPLKGVAPLLNADVTTWLTEKSQMVKRWVRHLRRALNCSSGISDNFID